MENGMDLLGAGLGVGFIVLIIILAIAEMVI